MRLNSAFTVEYQGQNQQEHLYRDAASGGRLTTKQNNIGYSKRLYTYSRGIAGGQWDEWIQIYVPDQAIECAMKSLQGPWPHIYKYVARWGLEAPQKCALQ